MIDAAVIRTAPQSVADEREPSRQIAPTRTPEEGATTVCFAGLAVGAGFAVGLGVAVGRLPAGSVCPLAFA